MVYQAFLDDNENALVALSIALKRLDAPLVITQDDLDAERGVIVREDYDPIENVLTITRKEPENAPPHLS